MTDAQNSTTIAQVIYAPSLPDARNSNTVAQVMWGISPYAWNSATIAHVLLDMAPDARHSGLVTQVIWSDVELSRYVRTVGSPRPLLVKWPQP